MSLALAVGVLLLATVVALAGGHGFVALFCALWAVNTFTEGRKA